jgi:hypothetical protein
VSKFLFSVYKFVRVFNKKSFTPLRGEEILWDRTDFSNEPMLSAQESADLFHCARFVSSSHKEQHPVTAPLDRPILVLKASVRSS